MEKTNKTCIAYLRSGTKRWLTQYFDNGTEVEIRRIADNVCVVINRRLHRQYPIEKIDRAVEVFLSINSNYPHPK